jgi:purine-nucleoside phosphorylase
MNTTFNAIVNPVIPKRAPAPGKTAILVSSESDLVPLTHGLDDGNVNPRKLFMSRHYRGDCGGNRVSLVGPIMGAPYAVALLDTLVAWGVQRFLFLGWCGSIAEQVSIGNIVVPDRAFIDEGTSRHYLGNEAVSRRPAGSLPAQVTALLDQTDITHHSGAVWTTDAIYRETEQQVRRFQEKGALAVEMEVSALFSAARFRGVELCSVLVTSDRLHDMRWQPGFKDSRFKAACESARKVILKVLSNQQDPGDG